MLLLLQHLFVVLPKTPGSVAPAMCGGTVTDRNRARLHARRTGESIRSPKVTKGGRSPHSGGEGAQEGSSKKKGSPRGTRNTHACCTAPWSTPAWAPLETWVNSAAGCARAQWGWQGCQVLCCTHSPGSLSIWVSTSSMESPSLRRLSGSGGV